MQSLQSIHSLTLEGFQVFDKPTHIPLSKLTFLIGPNSAGKSAVEDAIEILSELYGNANNSHYCSWADRIDVFNAGGMPSVLMFAGVGLTTNRFQRLHKHWRKTGEDVGDYAEKMLLGLSGGFNTDLASALGSEIMGDHNYENVAWKYPSDFLTEIGIQYLKVGLPYEGERDDFVAEVDIYTTFRFNTVDEDDVIESVQPLCDVELRINGVAVTKLFEDEKVGFNLNHWVFSYIDWGFDFKKAIKKYPEQISLQSGWLWLHASYMTGRTAFPSIFSHDKAWQESSLLAAIASKFQQAYNEVFSLVLGNWRPLNSSPHSGSIIKVPASRTIPSEKDLTILIDHWEQDYLFKNVEFAQQLSQTITNPLDAFGIVDTGDAQYYKLACSLTSNQLANPLAGKVNKVLQGDLFSERGYSISAVHLVISDPTNDNKSEIAKIVKIFLADAKGRKFSFNEVGSGLGYVLPVLCAVLDEKGKYENSVVLIQQPELHLHPALQAALGDIFIESVAPIRSILTDAEKQVSSENFKQLIIETHSEHILLRVLKRIRQTHAKNHLADELKIKPDDVCMLYFDPSIDGSTQVKRIRISNDGDFLDRWPRGFFGERDKELFDE